MQRVRENYVDAVDDHKLMQNAIRGMVESLDDHSTFLSADEFEDMKVTTSGSYAGIGVEVAPGKDGVSVVRAHGELAGRARRHPDRRRHRAHRRACAVDPADLDAAIARMRGPEGSAIHLAVRRAGASRAARVSRSSAPQVRLQSVAAELLTPDYGYLRISSFTDTTASELERAVARLERAQSGPPQGLRHRPAQQPGRRARLRPCRWRTISSITAPSSAPRAAPARRDFRMEAKPGDITHGATLVLLVNGGSASASEILAAALHDNHRATLIGRRTYGKGSVQTIMPLSGGQALKITTSRYFTPSGVSINGVGIVPDTVLDGPEDPPAEMDAVDDVSRSTLSRRDPQVSLALQALTGHPGQVARGPSDATATAPTLK